MLAIITTLRDSQNFSNYCRDFAISPSEGLAATSWPYFGPSALQADPRIARTVFLQSEFRPQGFRAPGDPIVPLR